jgi:hypothetical protein
VGGWVGGWVGGGVTATEKAKSQPTSWLPVS